MCPNSIEVTTERSLTEWKVLAALDRLSLVVLLGTDIEGGKVVSGFWSVPQFPGWIRPVR